MARLYIINRKGLQLIGNVQQIGSEYVRSLTNDSWQSQCSNDLISLTGKQPPNKSNCLLSYLY